MDKVENTQWRGGSRNSWNKKRVMSSVYGKTANDPNKHFIDSLELKMWCTISKS